MQPSPALGTRSLTCASAARTGKHWRALNSIRCSLESLEAPRRLRLRYPGDFIVGSGEWRLDTAPGGTRVTYKMNVVANGRLAVILGRVLPFAKIHSKVMQEVLANLEAEVRRRG